MDCAGASPGRNEQATQTQGPYLCFLYIVERSRAVYTPIINIRLIFFLLLTWTLFLNLFTIYIYMLYVVQFDSSKLKAVATTQPCSMPPAGQLPAAPSWSMTAPPIMCIQQLLNRLQWTVNPLCKSGIIPWSIVIIYIQETQTHTHTCCWCSLITNKPDRHCSVLIINQTKLTLFSGTLLITSFCLPRQPIISQGAPLEARTTSCWDGFFELLC